ncbi:MAG: proton-conducting transporter membrane subunit [Candidatus Margulisiibacteriota bacterium]
MNNFLPYFIIVPLIAALLALAVNRINKILPDILSVLATLYLLAATVMLYFFRPYNFVLTYKIGGTSLVLDGLSHLVLLAVNLVAFLVVLYSVPYMNKYAGKEKYYALYMLIISGMSGVLLTGDIFNLFIFMEIAALATYALVAFGGGAEELEASFRYAIIGTIASLLILLGIGFIYRITGTTNMSEIGLVFNKNIDYIKYFIAALFIAGFGMKAALVPFHSWLPDAHTAAPAPVSATLSGVLIKVLGVYAIIRIFYNVLGMTLQLSYALTFIGALSILIGGLLAFYQADLKRLMAYSTISQVGYIILGISLGTPLGIMGGLFHLFNHALFKPLLFMNAGSIEHSTGTRQLDKIGGISKKMPVTALTSFIGSLSISGIPPFNGFWSKLFIILACVQTGKVWYAFAAVIGSIITLVYYLKVQKVIYFENTSDLISNIKESHWLMSASVIALSLACLLMGIFYPYVITYLINPAVVAVLNGLGYGRTVGGAL